MESAVKDCEEETLQTAFKKLRVDAESSINTVHVCEVLAQKTACRTNCEGTKIKVASPKENWHGCMRKSSRGGVRSQRRRRSKSPILHPPKFTYSGSKSSPPLGRLKHKSLSDTEEGGAVLGVPAKKELLLSAEPTPASFHVAVREPYTHTSQRSAPQVRPSPLDPDAGTIVLGSEKTGGSVPSDFQSLSKLHDAGACPCAQECQCQGWRGVEVYSFTGLRDVISECERNLVGGEDSCHTSAQRRATCPPGSSGSPRSCSEQARAFVDDVTIEDLSGYMEYYLYIPKKMSHMAEMMYT